IPTVALGLLLVSSAACSNGTASASQTGDTAGSLQTPDPAVDRASTADLRPRICALINGRDSVSGLPAPEPVRRAGLRALYQPDNSPLWIDNAGRPTTNARDALAVLTQAADEGLDPADYGVPLVSDLASHIDGATQVDPARFDVVLSAGM